MKKYIIALSCICFIVLMSSCNDNANSASSKKSKFHDIIHNPNTADKKSISTDEPILSAKETEYIFGKANQGDIITREFEIINTGRRDLLILDSKSSCGCTVSEYPTEPLPPQAKSYVKVIFDTKGTSGLQEKKVSIYSNTNPNETIFVVKGEVIK